MFFFPSASNLHCQRTNTTHTQQQPVPFYSRFPCVQCACIRFEFELQCERNKEMNKLVWSKRILLSTENRRNASYSTLTHCTAHMFCFNLILRRVVENHSYKHGVFVFAVQMLISNTNGNAFFRKLNYRCSTNGGELVQCEQPHERANTMNVQTKEQTNKRAHSTVQHL